MGPKFRIQFKKETKSPKAKGDSRKNDQEATKAHKKDNLVLMWA
jgi:hypothetical protein